MAKQTRGKIRDRIDYSELLFEIKTNNTEFPIEQDVQDVSENVTDNSFDENRIICTFIKYQKVRYTKSIVSS